MVPQMHGASGVAWTMGSGSIVSGEYTQASMGLPQSWRWRRPPLHRCEAGVCAECVCVQFPKRCVSNCRLTLKTQPKVGSKRIHFRSFDSRALLGATQKQRTGKVQKSRDHMCSRWWPQATLWLVVGGSNGKRQSQSGSGGFLARPHPQGAEVALPCFCRLFARVTAFCRAAPI